jgi:predicted lipoprotein with Yx(FWY)xxD motif
LRRLLTVGVTVLILGSMIAAVAQAAIHHPARSAGDVRNALRGHARAHTTASKGATIKLGNTGAGAVLTNSKGHVLFIFTKDKRKKDKCRAIKHCEANWPAVTTTGKPVAGPGVKKSLLGTIPYKGKTREVTYGGHPLHTYKHDGGAELSFMDIGIKQYGGRWYGLTATDAIVKTPSG